MNWFPCSCPDMSYPEWAGALKYLVTHLPMKHTSINSHPLVTTLEKPLRDGWVVTDVVAMGAFTVPNL